MRLKMKKRKATVQIPIEEYEQLLEDAKLTCNDILAENISLSVDVDYYKKQYGEQFEKVAKLHRDKYVTDGEIKDLEIRNNQLKEKYEELLIENNELNIELCYNKLIIITLGVVSIVVSILLIISVL